MLRADRLSYLEEVQRIPSGRLVRTESSKVTKSKSYRSRASLQLDRLVLFIAHEKANLGSFDRRRETLREYFKARRIAHDTVHGHRSRNTALGEFLSLSLGNRMTDARNRKRVQ